ncbi:MotE family protein [Pseudoneobacillus sp. C159]
MKEKMIEKLGSIFYLCLFPILFFVIFAGVSVFFFDTPIWKYLTFAGSNKNEANLSKSSDDWENRYHDIELELKEKNTKISELDQLLRSNQKKVNELIKNNEDLQNQLTTKKYQDFHNQMQQVAELYENMTPSKAASIFQTMPLEEVVQIVLFLDRDLQSDIIEKMKDTKKAGQITLIMKEVSDLTEYDETTLKQHIKKLTTQIQQK